MKKLITVCALILCTVMLFSCSLFGGSEFDTFNKAVVESDSSNAVFTVETTGELGIALTSTFNITYNDDGTATIEYTREEFESIGTASDIKKVTKGTITRKADGTYTDNKGFTANADELTIGFDLDLKKIEDKVEIEENVLTCTVEAGDTESVLGVALDYDVELEIKLNDGKLDTISASFIDGKYSGTISCKYE